MWKIMLSTVLLLLPLLSCKAPKKQNLAGNVYIIKSLSSETNHSDKVRAIRIDYITADTLLIKYKIGAETFMDADFIWFPPEKRYHSSQPITYGKHAQYKSEAILHVEDKQLHLFLVDDNLQFTFVKAYKQAIDKKTHRNPYYAEDGFPLPPDL